MNQGSGYWSAITSRKNPRRSARFGMRKAQDETLNSEPSAAPMKFESRMFCMTYFNQCLQAFNRLFGSSPVTWEYEHVNESSGVGS